MMKMGERFFDEDAISNGRQIPVISNGNKIMLCCNIGNILDKGFSPSVLTINLHRVNGKYDFNGQWELLVTNIMGHE
jgi:hypothetical protein